MKNQMELLCKVIEEICPPMWEISKKRKYGANEEIYKQRVEKKGE